ncbi:MAG TPA: copper homeostasis protein CutC [Terriglobales bacterium]|nr:copper homeostasis protein CutC [Terriglobales bacterium]
MNNSITIEICADSVESALAAQRGGAGRIELCGGLAEGGTTPSSGLISTVRSKVSIPIYVMVRPRAGDFYYGPDDFETMEQDVLIAKQLGADGVVFGVLKEDGRVDVQKTRHLVALARPMKVTFHRAFDMALDLSEGLEAVIAAGADRLLTSGGEQRVEDGLDTVKSLTAAASGRIAMMACGGISAQNVCHVIAATGVNELHASASSAVSSPMLHRNERVSMGAIKGREYQRFVVMEDKVRRLVNAVNGTLHTAKAH